jgi:hypothetical protein
VYLYPEGLTVFSELTIEQDSSVSISKSEILTSEKEISSKTFLVPKDTLK